MPEDAVAAPETKKEIVQPTLNEQLASAMWNNNLVQQPAKKEEVPAAATPAPETDETIGIDEYFNREFGIPNATEAKQKWQQYLELEKNPPKPEEIKYENEDSRRYMQAILGGKSDDLYDILHRQRQLERIEKLPLEKTDQALDVLRTNLQYKNPNLKSEDVDFLLEETYAKPNKPLQSVEQTDEDYKIQVEAWEQQIQRIDRKMIIDAKLAQPEIATYKSKLVLPEIPKVETGNPEADQKALEAKEAFRSNFAQVLGSNYQNFKGYNVTAKDGEVELPISYGISPEELAASKQELENLDVNGFLDSRWFDDKGNPNITLMQEDLYLLKNRDKIFQKIANEASAQRFKHDLKVKNNINLNGVNNEQPASNGNGKDTQKQLAETIWSL